MLALPASATAVFVLIIQPAQHVNQAITTLEAPVLPALESPVLPPAAAQQLLSHALMDII
jgi:hypothetical protein